MTKTCVSCGRENPEDSEYCNRCGRRLEETRPSHVPSQAKICPYCGSLNPPYAEFCLNCAKDLPQKNPVAASRYCAWCGGGVPEKAMICPRCGHDPAGPSTMYLDAVPRPRSLKPLIAVVLLIGSGILDIISAIGLLTANLSSAAARAGVPTEFVSPLEGFLQICGTLALVFGLIACTGGSLAYMRRTSTLAIVAAIFGMLGVGPFYLGSALGLIALILIAISRDDFED